MKRKSAATVEPTSKSAPLHAAQRFAMRRVPREKLEAAAYNPRGMAAASRQHLREGLADSGLVMPLVWNERTGRLVAGHQRLKLLDEMAAGKGYSLDVAAIDVDEAHERALNVLLNNPSAHGYWDPEKLEALLRGGLDWKRAGFDAFDLQTLVDAPDLAPMFSDAAQPTDVRELIEQAGDFHDEAKAAGLEEIKARKKEARAEDMDKNDPGHIAVIVFRTRKERDAFVRRVGGQDGSQYVDGARVVGALKEE